MPAGVALLLVVDRLELPPPQATENVISRASVASGANRRMRPPLGLNFANASNPSRPNSDSQAASLDKDRAARTQAAATAARTGENSLRMKCVVERRPSTTKV